MFADVFARVPLELLDAQHEYFLAQGLRPEIYVSGDILTRLTPAAVRRTKRLLRSFSAHTVHAPFLDLAPGGADADVRSLSLNKMQRLMSLAEDWGSRLVVMHFNFDAVYYRGYFGGWLERAADFFLELISSPSAPPLALENIAEPSPFVYLQLCERIRSERIFPCFDFGHHHVFSAIPFDEWLFYLHPRRTIHFHLHDNHGDRDQHLPLGRGNIDWLRAKKTIVNLGFEFTITLESHTLKDLKESFVFYRKNFL